MKLQIARAIWHCGCKWPTIARGEHPDPEKNKLRLHYWGFKDPRLVYDNSGDASHDLTDFLVEWSRLNNQRAAKAGSWLILWLVAGNIALLLALLVSVALAIIF